MRLPGALILGLLAACSDKLPPRGEVLLYVTTDAPLPPPVDDPSYAVPVPALFDRLRIEVFPPGETVPCTGCTRELAIDARIVASGNASVGLVPKPNVSGYRARVRLFRSLGREPRPASTIETVVALPVVAEEGIVNATVVLHTDDVAQPRGTLDAPVATDAGLPAHDLPGKWPSAARTTCGGNAGPGEVCVPGGAFWMGNPNVDYVGPEADGDLERLVVLSPYYLDDHEVTVADMRAFKPVALDDPHRPTMGWEGCAYTQDAGANEALPINCLTWVLAQGYCKKQGKRLPTEAEHEYVQGAREGRPHPWGEDPPDCADAIAQRDGTMCPGALPEPAGSGKRDRVALDTMAGSPELVDLAANVAEWVADAFQFQTEPCWGTGIFTDPLCKKSMRLADAHSFRGGAFNEGSEFLHTSLRRNVVGSLGVNEAIGFRCARTPE